MDDPDEDWEIEEQTNCEYYEGGGGGVCNVRWVWEKGINLGKKAVITGFVMSSAPVVLPPILVVSAVGFACSVPFGLVFTGYACTQKLMSTLLPMPTASPMLEYDHMFDDEAEKVEGRGEWKDRVESRVYMEEEEIEQMDDLRTGVEERIELVKNENEVPRGREEVEDSKDITRDNEVRRTSENISLKEEGYEEDDDERLVYNKKSSEEIVAGADTGQEESINEESKCEELFPKEDALEPSDKINYREEEKEQMDDQRAGVEDRIELVKNENEEPPQEDSRDIRREDELRTSENISLKEEGYEEDDDKPSVYKNESSEEMVAQADMLQEESIPNNQERKYEELLHKEDTLGPSDWKIFRGKEGEWEVTELKIEGEGHMGSEKSINEKLIGAKFNDGMKREEIDLEIEESGAMKEGSKDVEVEHKVELIDGIISGEHSELNATLEPGVIGEFRGYQTRVNNEEEDIKRGSVGLLETIREEGNAGDVPKETKNKKKKKNKKKETSAGSSEILLPEVKDQIMISKNLTVGNAVTENQKLEDSSQVGKQQPPARGATGSDNLIPLQKSITTSEETNDNGGADPLVISNVEVVEISVTASIPNATVENTSDVDSALPTEKEFVDEEKKIWEQIDALRAIVGYKATPYRSSIDEVKALYTFTGVELPSSFGNRADLAELSNKLRFLMSILGVK